jgi:ABC-type polar amino acid transport system ATPase subunit
MTLLVMTHEMNCARKVSDRVGVPVGAALKAAGRIP